MVGKDLGDVDRQACFGVDREHDLAPVFFQTEVGREPALRLNLMVDGAAFYVATIVKPLVLERITSTRFAVAVFTTPRLPRLAGGSSLRGAPCALYYLLYVSAAVCADPPDPLFVQGRL